MSVGKKAAGVPIFPPLVRHTGQQYGADGRPASTHHGEPEHALRSSADTTIAVLPRATAARRARTKPRHCPGGPDFFLRPSSPKEWSRKDSRRLFETPLTLSIRVPDAPVESFVSSDLAGTLGPQDARTLPGTTALCYLCMRPWQDPWGQTGREVPPQKARRPCTGWRTGPK